MRSMHLGSQQTCSNLDGSCHAGCRREEVPHRGHLVAGAVLTTPLPLDDKYATFAVVLHVSHCMPYLVQCTALLPAHCIIK